MLHLVPCHVWILTSLVHGQTKYRVIRDAAWLANTVTHLELLLRRVLPPLASSRHPKVRQALAESNVHLYLLF